MTGAFFGEMRNELGACAVKSKDKLDFARKNFASPLTAKAKKECKFNRITHVQPSIFRRHDFVVVESGL
jgi:hypothetical protein